MSFSGCDGRLDIIFAIDASGSIRNNHFEDVIEFLVDVVREMDVRPEATRVGAICWSDSASIEFQLNTYNNKQVI